MEIVGIICEYNPFHNGHLRQLRLAREAAGEGSALVCLMSGNYVQRGEPAIFPKALRAEAALRCGADLVLELPLTAVLSSAEGFAAGGVAILSALGCARLCYGIESEDNNLIMSTAKANLDPAFDALLRSELERGCSYPAARQRALERLGAGEGADEGRSQGPVPSRPNDILAVEYCKALLRQNSPMQPLPIHRPDTYHSSDLDPAAPSASTLRQMLRRDEHCSSEDWRAAMPEALRALYEAAPVHSWEAGERAVLARVRTLPDEAFAALPFGSEGLWSKLMKSCRVSASVEEILDAVKSKRYTRSRIRRMLLCAFLGLRAGDLETPPPYVRVLGFNERGRAALREMKARPAESNPPIALINAGERPADGDYYALERRAADLYSLFSAAGPRPGGEEERQRVLVFP